MADIDRNSPIPIYHQLKTLIQGQVEGGIWRRGERIPTEQELCQLYDISRSPVRQALNDLANEGILIRRPGRGTFVSNSFPASSLHSSIPIQIMSSDHRWSTVLEHVSNVWNEGHPNQKVTFQVRVVDHNQLYHLLSKAVGSGTAPDVAMVDCVWVAGLAQSGFLHALEDLSSQWNHTKFRQDLYPAFVEANSFNDQLYGLPLKADVSLLWYRKDWFAQEGLEPPYSWDDLLNVAKHFLQSRVREQYGLMYPLVFPGGMTGGEATVYNMMPFIWSAGGRVFDGESVVLDAPSTRQALQFLRELVNLHHVSPPEVVSYKCDTIPWLFATGKAAMALDGSHESDAILATSGWSNEEFMQRVGCVVPPAAPVGRPVSTVGGISYVILRQCRHPDLVLDVLKTAISPDVTGDMYRAILQNSPCPSFNDFLSPEAETLLTRVSRMIESGFARPSVPGYFRVSRQLQAMFEAAISDSMPIDEIVRRKAELISVISEQSHDQGHL
ncbi:MAG: extracellular solute-binding protein [Chloroflexota bacterium]|nr:extracellular solute-binding protein [Chloroflexota bacterium]